MPDRFGGSTDYSAQFGYLAETYLNNLEDQADKAESRRESEQAGKDQEAFARYEAGKMSDDDLLAYIRRRIAQTAYDPKQQSEWKKALLEYSESINDAKALREFERTKDYNGYLTYLRAKAAGMKGNAAKKAEIEKQIQSLVAQRDTNSVSRGADRILLDIQRGKATYRDLLAFYRERLKDVSDPALKSQIRGQVTELVGRVRSDSLQLRVADLGRRLASRDITPQQYGKQLQAIAENSGYKATNPAQYNAWMDDATKAINTVVDVGRLDHIDGMLARGEITPQQAMTMYYAEADRYKIADPKQYEVIRNLGWQVGHKPVEPVPGQTPLPNGGILGLPDNKITSGGFDPVKTATDIAKQFRFFSQIDGTEFGQVNCVYTSAAMMAYAMGYREQGGGGITGGDLRYLSGDRSIGTNLDEAEAALARLGITGLRNWNDKHMAFEQFKKRIGEHGQAGVLMGVNNNLPDSLKAFAGAAKGHGVFIAAYDAKKDAFLWYDPAISKNSHPNYNGVWVDASVVKNFGWGPSYSDGTGSWSFSGQVLLTPPNTIKGRFSANDVRRPDIKYVNVDDAPVRPQTPKNYRGYNNPGPSVRSRYDNPVIDSKGRPRAAGNGRWFTDDGNRIDTVEEVQAELAKDQKRLEVLSQLDDAFGKGKDKTTIGGKEYILTPALFSTLDKERLHLFDKGILFSEAAGLGDAQDWYTKNKNTFLISAATRNSLDASAIMNNVVRNSLRIWNEANKDPDPFKAVQSARALDATIKILTGVLKAKASGKTAKDINGNTIDDPLDDLSSDPTETGSIPQLELLSNLFDLAANPSDLPLSERLGDLNSLLGALGADSPDDPLNQLAMGMAEKHEGIRQLQSGESVLALDGQTGQYAVVPATIKTDIATGEQFAVPKKGNVNDPDFIQVPFQTDTGIEMRWVLPGLEQFGSRLSVAKNANELAKELGISTGTALNESALQKLIDKGGEPYIQSLIAGGLLREEPIMFSTVRMPGERRGGRVESGPLFVQDPGSMNWYQGVIPAVNLGKHVGKYFAVGTDLMPEFEWKPNATAGMTPLPFSGNRVAVQEAADRGEIVLPKTFSRGMDGTLDPNATESNAAFYNKYDPLSSAYLTAKPKEEDPTERAERIRTAVEDAVRLARDYQYQNRYQGDLFGPSTIDPAEPVQSNMPVNDRSGIQTGLPGSTPAPRGDRAFTPGGPLGPTDGFGPQGEGATSALPSLTDLASSLGVKTGGNVLPGPKGPQGPQLPGPKGPQPYTPPAAKQVRGPGGKKEIGLPKIGSSVMVGGTRIDLPSSGRTSAPPPQKKFTPPPPKMGSGGAAAATISMLGGSKGETKKGPGGTKS